VDSISERLRINKKIASRAIVICHQSIKFSIKEEIFSAQARRFSLVKDSPDKCDTAGTGDHGKVDIIGVDAAQGQDWPVKIAANAASKPPHRGNDLPLNPRSL